MKLRPKVDETGHIKWGLVAPLFGVFIVFIGFIGQYAVMGSDVQNIVEDVDVLDNRVYSVEKVQAVYEKDIEYIKQDIKDIKETISKFDGKLDKLIAK
ncbi:hypothetical protein LCGC14_1436630 [marine sediment metagenome]|uniref:Uncharacterized protein n=1 Tax=marine sediment metagenome TaxID=412755 RepID=A0A0F9JMJ7_9ZZZZ